MFRHRLPDAHKGFVENKGWKSPADAVESFVNLEKLFGADKAGRTAVLPKDENDAEGRKAFYAKIGVPDSADAYELPLPDGDDGSFAKTASGWFHQHGVPKAAAQGIAKAWNEHISKLVADGEAAEKQASEHAANEVRASWGPEAAKKEEHARRAFRHVFGEDKLATYEKALGTAEFLKMAALVGEKIAEPGFAGEGGGGGSFSMQPSVAKARIEELRTKRLANQISEKEFFAEMERLGPIAAQAS
jgi:hypothetical protein